MVTTDDAGNFLMPGVLVPDLKPGITNVTVDIGGTTATIPFEVPASSGGLGALIGGGVEPAVAFAPLIENNNMIRAWYFDPATQDIGPDFGWFLFDPRPVFAPANTIEDIGKGKFYWITVRENQTAVLGGTLRTLFAGWNPVIW